MAAFTPLTAFLCLAGALLATGNPVTPDILAAGCPEGCPVGWTPFGTRCFKFFGTLVTWPQAEKSCHSHGANLASIHNADEQAFVAGLIRKDQGLDEQTWVGGHNKFGPAFWMWSDGTLMNYDDWGVDQPDAADHYVAFNLPAVGFWDNIEETRHLKSVCSKNAPPKVCQ